MDIVSQVSGILRNPGAIALSHFFITALLSFSSQSLIIVFVYPFFFRSDSGYDFGYLVKLLTAMTLPTSEDIFFESLRTWFPHCYDIKFMMRACKSLKGGLQDVADDLGVRPFYFLSHPIPRNSQ